MKRKIAIILTLALSVALLGGCGGNSKTATSDNGSGAVSSENKSTGKGNTLSSFLSKEKSIGYVISTVDKSKTPSKIYFFENGKVTILPGSAFGLTLGEFSKMSDKEIWETYETVRETYKETYLAEKEKSESVGDKAVKKYCEQENADFGNAMSYEEVQWAADILQRVKDKKHSEVVSVMTADVVNDEKIFSTDERLSEAAEICLINYCNFAKPSLAEEEYFWRNYNWGDPDSKTYAEQTYSGAVLDAAIEFYQKVSKEVDSIKKELSYKGPFYDLPISFILTTDSSGNNVKEEMLVYPTLEDIVGEIPETTYGCLSFGNVEGATKQIYDTSYDCYGIENGREIYCSRDVMKLDTVDSKNVLIDLSNEELNALFEKEVTARYE